MGQLPSYWKSVNLGDPKLADFFRGSILQIEEKIDGSNVGIFLDEDQKDSLILIRNRQHILSKNYQTKTPAQKQFLPLWTWAQEHRHSLKVLNDYFQCSVCVYGEWVFALHGIDYDKLPDKFIAFAVYVPSRKTFYSSYHVGDILSSSGLQTPHVIYRGELQSMDTLVYFTNHPSAYRSNGFMEGVVIKTNQNIYKIVRGDYQPNEQWNKKELIKQSSWR